MLSEERNRVPTSTFLSVVCLFKKRENTMRSLVIAVATTLTIAGSAALLNTSAQAAAGAGLAPAATDIGNVEKAQFLFGGHRHCWYPDGWHGGGWYWCGYRTRAGMGWGGGEGYNGWRTPERVRIRREHHID
jgi:hypothetical protein